MTEISVSLNICVHLWLAGTLFIAVILSPVNRRMEQEQYFLSRSIGFKRNTAKHNLSKLLSNLYLISRSKSDGQAQPYVTEGRWMLIMKSTAVLFTEKLKFGQIVKEMRSLTKWMYKEGNSMQKEKLEKRL